MLRFHLYAIPTWLTPTTSDANEFQAVKLSTLFTLSSFVLSNLVWVIDIFGWVLPQRNLPEVGFITMIVLGNIFLTTTFAGMLMVVSNCELPSHGTTDNARYDPDEIDVQHGAKSGFDHNGLPEIDQSSLRHSHYSAAEESKILTQPRISQAVVGVYHGVWSVMYRARDGRKYFLETTTIRWITARKLASVAMTILPISAIYDSWKFYNMIDMRSSDSEIPRLHLKFNFRFWSTGPSQGNLTGMHLPGGIGHLERDAMCWWLGPGNCFLKN